MDAVPNGDLDLRVHLFTKKFGKLTAKVKSARKITSKLAGHLQPGNVIQVRLVEKNGLQAVNALKNRRLETDLNNLRWLNRMLAEFQPDLELWEVVLGGPDATVGAGWDWRRVLGILGWDPREAECHICRKPPAYFRVGDQHFFCEACALKTSPDELIYLGNRS